MTAAVRLRIRACRRSASRALSCLAVAVATTCAVGCDGLFAALNGPDRDQLLDVDASRERDAGLPDATVDAFLPDAGPPIVEERGQLCRDGRDNDFDGLVDCADGRYCATSPSCCAMGDALFNEMWSSSAAWATFPAGSTAVVAEDGELRSFGSDGMLRALRRRSCQPLALGFDFTFSLRNVGTSTCAGCDTAALVLTRAREPSATEQGFLQELRIGRGADGGVVVSRAERIVAVHPTTESVANVHVQLAPGIEGSEGALFATVSVDDTVVVEHVLVTLARDLVRDSSSCSEVPGLFLAVEGRGAAMHVGPITARTLRCGNPATFTRLGGPVQTQNVAPSELDEALPADWARGGIGSPSLLMTTTEHNSMLAFDAVASPRENEIFSRDQFVLGAASTSSDQMSMSTWMWASRTTPKGRDDCLVDGASCRVFRSLRDPFLYVPLDSAGRFAGSQINLVARELDEASNQYEIVNFVWSGSYVESTAFGLYGDSLRLAPHTLEAPAGFSSCSSLRDPSLAPIGSSTPTQSYLLFFTCLPSTGGSPRIDVVRISSSLRVIGGSHHVVATSDTVAFATRGVRGPEPIARHDAMSQTTSLRLFFVGTSSDGTQHVGLLEGQLADDAIPSARAQEWIRPYGINPVLSPTTVVGGAPVCTEPCSLQALAVSRHPLQNDLVFLVARRVNPDATSVRYDLLPLVQQLEPYWDDTP